MTAAQIAVGRCQLSGSSRTAGAGSAPAGGFARVPSRLDTARYGLTIPCPMSAFWPSGGLSAVRFSRSATCCGSRLG
ncbi:hypothetical protein PSN01_03046 [Micromonospora saelicesensis]|nr:hypothetical protein PSN01_03046 [Micromonospora saelicesensis]